jgi:glyoxylase-like metal-dependent hydrolase (beta-lactamase superfamily II)
MLLVETFAVGAFQCNCTILADEATREAIIVDPGDDPGRILQRLRAYDLKVRYLLHTHAHLDHIMGTKLVKQETGAEVLLHSEDDWLYRNLAMQCGMFGWNADEPPPVDRHLADGQILTLGSRDIEVVHTPGHTPGSLCFALGGEEPLLFSGDTLFARGIGRTDLWGGSFPQILESIRGRLLTRPDPTRVIPGHGPRTTIGEERRKNPFLT